MPGKLVKTPYDDLTYRIIGSAMAVHRAQGSGKRESNYQRALEAQFTKDGLAFVAEKNIEVYHEDRLIGLYIPDLSSKIPLWWRSRLCLDSTTATLPRSSLIWR